MITIGMIEGLLKPVLEQDNCFLVGVNVSAGNRIVVHIDGPSDISIDYCIRLSRLIEQSLDRETEDFELEVSSPGIGQPFKVKEQYIKAVGRPVEVLTNESKTVKGILKDVDKQTFIVVEEKIVKGEGKKKKKELQILEHRFSFETIKRVKELVEL